MKLVSIIIPYYKKKKFLKEAIYSVLNQSYRKFEIIIVYDDEDLSDLSYIQELKKKDNRIKILINKKNLGAGISRNKGIKFSKGNFLAFLDADDIWHKDKIKYQLNFLKKNNCKVCHTSYLIIDENKMVKGKREARSFNNVNQLLKSCDIGLSTVMISRSVLKNLRFSNRKTKEDFILWLQILKNKVSIIGMKKNLVKWRKLSNSLSASSWQKIIDGFYVYYRYMDFNFIKSLYFLFLLSINFLKKNVR